MSARTTVVMVMISTGILTGRGRWWGHPRPRLGRDSRDAQVVVVHGIDQGPAHIGPGLVDGVGDGPGLVEVNRLLVVGVVGAYRHGQQRLTQPGHVLAAARALLAVDLVGAV